MASRARRCFFAALALGPSTGCFYDWDLPVGPDAVDGGEGGTLDSSADSAGDAGLDAPPDVPPPGDGSTADVPPPPPGPCKSAASNECPKGMYCKFPDHNCGMSGLQGTCTSIAPCSDAGDSLATYFCACSGEYFKDQCSAYTQGGDLSVRGCSNVDTTHYPCGYLYCASQKAACAFHASNGSYECVDETVIGCQGTVSCACATETSYCGGFTCVDVDGGVSLKCPQ